jgi:hypothetical protein
VDKLVLLWDGELGPDHVEEEGGGHDGSAVHQGVVRLPWVNNLYLYEIYWMRSSRVVDEI